MRRLIVCPGSINPDFVIRSPKPLKLTNRSMTFSGTSAVYAGGKGRNQAVAARRIGADVTLVGCVGKDFLGNSAISGLKKEKIKTIIKRMAETGKCILSVFKGEFQIVGLDLGANSLLKTKDIPENIIKKSDMLLCQIENTKETTFHSLRLAKKHKKFTILNPSLVQDKKYIQVFLLPNTDLIVLNSQEATQLTGIKITKNNLRKAALRLKTDYVIITLGSKGCYAYFKGDEKFVHAFKVKEVDTTACGDVFIGALAATLNVKTFSKFIASVKFASAAAALSVTKIGASESAPYKHEVELFLHKF